MINHISFDVWLTLIRSNQTFKSLLNELMIDSFDVKKDAQFVDSVFRKNDRIFTKINEITGKNLDSNEMLLVILAQLDVAIEKINEEQLEKFNLQLLELFWKNPPILIEEKFPLIAEKLFQSGITLSILSNTGFIHGKNLKHLFDYFGFGQYFSFQCYSDEENLSKPSFHFFDIAYQEVLKIKNVEKNQILHIGDNPIADRLGAENFGFKAALYNHEKIKLENIFLEYGIF